MEGGGVLAGPRDAERPTAEREVTRVRESRHPFDRTRAHEGRGDDQQRGVLDTSVKRDSSGALQNNALVIDNPPV